MQSTPDIIQSDIVKQQQDVYWQPLTDGVPAQPVKLLVITTPLTVNSAEEAQLQKIIQACKLDATDYYIYTLEHATAWHQLRDRLQPQAVLLFGVLPQQLGISAMFGLYHPNRFDDAIWIPSISIAEMEKHPDTKKQLWVDGLKPVFIDKTIGNI
ncbi:hypothetical protein CAP35_09610 [Chitinophagaceae bacterium IBVUCB1]|nr:hypothetical protein CAP35_09610 [Chitinophagaceae bacterium IBVUCB1]